MLARYLSGGGVVVVDDVLGVVQPLVPERTARGWLRMVVESHVVDGVHLVEGKALAADAAGRARRLDQFQYRRELRREKEHMCQTHN